MTTKNLVFIDIETTGLNWNTSVPWEVGAIDFDGNVLFHEMWTPTESEMAEAEPIALSMTKFYNRTRSPETASIRGRDAKHNASRLVRVLDGKTLAGAAVHFDMIMLDKFLRRNGQCPTWSHRVLDVQTYVAGRSNYAEGVSLGETAKRIGVPYDREQKHSALYDAWLARECYLACANYDKLGSRGDPKWNIPFNELNTSRSRTGGGAGEMGEVPAMGRPSLGR